MLDISGMTDIWEADGTCILTSPHAASGPWGRHSKVRSHLLGHVMHESVQLQGIFTPQSLLGTGVRLGRQAFRVPSSQQKARCVTAAG